MMKECIVCEATPKFPGYSLETSVYFSKNMPQNERFLGAYVRRRWTTANVGPWAYIYLHSP